MKNRLKAAVDSVEAPPYLAARVRAHIQAGPRSRRRMFALASAGLAATLCLGFAFAYQTGSFRYSKASQISYIRSVSSQLSVLMRVGLGDHIICSVYRKYPKNAPAVDVLAQKLPAGYRDLIPAVLSQVPSDYKLLISHQCRLDGRRFVHLSLENGSHVLSLVITARKDGESFRAEGLLPALLQSDLPIYQSAAARFAITALETPKHLVYFVSDLPQQQNTRILTAMAPAVRDLLQKVEG